MLPKSKVSARRYAARLSEMHGAKWLPFQTPEGSHAMKFGVKFGACRETERAEYEAGGAIFFDDPSEIVSEGKSNAE